MFESIKNALIRLAERIFGTKYERDMKRIGPIVDQINAHCVEYESLSEEALKGMTERFRSELADGATLDDLLPRAYAVVKEACRRHVGQSWPVVGQEIKWEMIPYDVQLVGGIVLHEGRIAEMATGEGKTLVALMPIYLNALPGNGVHLITVNDYLAQRDLEWVGRILQYLGLTVGVIKHSLSPTERRESYACDVTYGTNSEFGFDYLRDNMAVRAEDQVQRGHNFTIIDEVDNILIDEARTPLIISGPVTKTNENYTALKPNVERIVRAQMKLVNAWVQEVESAIGDDPEPEVDYDIARQLLRIRRGAPKNKRFMKMMSERPSLTKDIRRIEFEANRDKAMAEIDEELFYSVDEKTREVDLSEKGRATLAPDDPQMFVLPDLALHIEEIEADEALDPKERVAAKEAAFRTYAERADKIHSTMQLLRSYSLYVKDVDYVVQDGKVMIVDEFTGRLMAGRRWSDGLHQAVEAKEGVTVEGETQTFATITLQNYFRLYNKLSGMTGTAETEASEFWEIYKLDVIKIPTNQQIMRDDQNDLIYRTRREKYNAIVEYVQALHDAGRPVLVGTTTVDVSETLSRLMKRVGLKHNVLNAKHHQREAEIVSRAGERGSVTIATNMAGRGTDIKLGEGVLPRDGDPGSVDSEGNLGLAIVGSERHESRRIDRQLRGRAGRQGDPGSSRFFLSLEDDLMRLFGSDRVGSIMQKMGAQEGDVIEHPWVTRGVENAQKKVEEQNFSIRKRLLEYDDVMNKQREVIYGIRGRALQGESMREEVVSYLERVVEGQVDAHGEPNEPFSTDALRLVAAELEMLLVNPMPVDALLGEEPPGPEAVAEHLKEQALSAYERRENDWGEELTREVERRVILSVIDEKWRDHLYEMDMLKEGISLRAYGQKDPLIEYKREGFQTFEAMMEGLNEDIVRRLFRVSVLREGGPGQAPEPVGPRVQAPPVTRESHAAYNALASGTATATSAPPETANREPVRADKKVGRNDPCPCGSGKKFKKCHGA